jgi:hypothetical protein
VGVFARLLARFRRKPTLTVFAEQDAYTRLHGTRSGEVSVTPVPPPAPRTLPHLSSDHLRRCFEERLDRRRAAHL